MNLLLFLKLLTVFAFLIMFWRRSDWIWGVGLLTVTTALFLDTALQIFGSGNWQADLGLFSFVIQGMLLGGGALWLWGFLAPTLGFNNWASTNTSQPSRILPPPPPPPNSSQNNTAIDRQMLFDQIRYRLSPADINNLLFDVGANENDIFAPGLDMNDIIIRLMDFAQESGRMGELAVAVERTLTPLPPEQLPRVSRLTEETPPAVWRHFLISNYNLDELATIAAHIEIDWEQIPGDTKSAKVRELLLYLYRRNRLIDLLDFLQSSTTEAQPSPPTPKPAGVTPITIDTPVTQIAQYLIAQYNLSEMKDIAFDLDINWEDISGQGKRVKIQNFVLHLERNQQLEQLVALLAGEQSQENNT
ncbi:MAG TPA: hypothetical protein VLL52_10480 [Anaerolineae bacterium]|nr:hypothetical protein [Anaerolineae bacterium]